MTSLIEAAACLHRKCCHDSEARSRSQSIAPPQSSSTPPSSTQPLHMPLLDPVWLQPPSPWHAHSPVARSVPLASVVSAPPVPPMQSSKTGTQESRHVMTDKDDFSLTIMAVIYADTVITFLDRLLRIRADIIPDDKEFHLRCYQRKDFYALCLQYFALIYIFNTPGSSCHYLSVW